ncbi:MAG TPA: SIS domain-containing protein, partial [Methanosarcina vacuolata]|nr:SIS domain-containing protein [Methanosarcina vacuolata]
MANLTDTQIKEIEQRTSNFQGLDTEDMYHKIIHLPEQVKQAYENANVHLPKSFVQLNMINQVVICGMGGSAISGDLAQAAFGRSIPIFVCKDYKLPAITARTLVVLLSYSGNTEETISCCKEAMGITPYVGAVTSGGELKKLVDGKFLWIELVGGNPPRSAIASLFFSLLRVLEEFQVIPSQQGFVSQAVAMLMLKAGALSSANPFESNLAKSSALAIQGKIPLVYSAIPEFASVAYRWKCQINENAKYPAFFHTLPEMNHNEIEGWEIKGMNETFMPIFLAPMKLTDRYARRIQAFKTLLTERKQEWLEFYAEG